MEDAFTNLPHGRSLPTGYTRTEPTEPPLPPLCHELTHRVAIESTLNKKSSCLDLFSRVLLRGYHEVKEYVVP